MNPFSRKKEKSNSLRLTVQESRKFILSPKSDFYIREAYNSLRTNVMYSLAGTAKCKVIVVTAAGPAEGKSTTALNFAINLAMANNRVLLIDADMRKPRLNLLIGIKNPGGLSNALLDINSVRQLVQPYQEVPMLHFLFSGNIPPNPSELLASDQMEELLKLLKEDYDYIIIDTPPINMVTDAVLLGPKTNGVMFVVRSGVCERGALTAAIEQLQLANAKVLGCVLNGVEMQKSGVGKSMRYQRYGRYGYRKYGYGYGKYGYGYGYGYESNNEDSEGSDDSENVIVD